MVAQRKMDPVRERPAGQHRPAGRESRWADLAVRDLDGSGRGGSRVVARRRPHRLCRAIRGALQRPAAGGRHRSGHRPTLGTAPRTVHREGRSWRRLVDRTAIVVARRRAARGGASGLGVGPCLPAAGEGWTTAPADRRRLRSRDAGLFARRQVDRPDVQPGEPRRTSRLDRAHGGRSGQAPDDACRRRRIGTPW
jgi:hypothetical protein